MEFQLSIREHKVKFREYVKAFAEQVEAQFDAFYEETAVLNLVSHIEHEVLEVSESISNGNTKVPLQKRSPPQKDGGACLPVAAPPDVAQLSAREDKQLHFLDQVDVARSEAQGSSNKVNDVSNCLSAASNDSTAGNRNIAKTKVTAESKAAARKERLDSKERAEKLAQLEQQMSAPSGSRRMFSDKAELKEKIQKNMQLASAGYRVEDLYSKSGIFVRIATNHWFEQITLLVIGINAVWIAVDTDLNHADLLSNALPVFQIAEQSFCTFFVVEWLIRFLALARKRDFRKDIWLVFDLVLVAMMVVELWILTLFVALSGLSFERDASNASILRLLRLLRLARMARMARLFRAFPELMIMMKGIAVATRSVMITFIMLTLLLYVFAIGFTQLLRDTGPGDIYFFNVLESMNTLIHYGVLLEDAPTVLTDIGAESIIYRLLFLSFIMMAPFTLLNMLIGVMCETIRIVSETENEEYIVSMTRSKLFNMMVTSGLDSDGDCAISKDEFAALLELPDACMAFRQLGVDVIGLVELQDFIFQEEEPLEFPEFMEIVLSLRGTNQATVKDIVDLRRFIKKVLETQAEYSAESQCSAPTTPRGIHLRLT
eukprot:TRINITY_DN76318_c0_g1_i1.p1 TRINITY_DN76318_c0_g1~~TRINITY_DN76318_c0_g1_i1.p1  ORF type:complete len:609 (-),score=121.22 TRINITY_DN76318_c0_g1_i1:47-1852(-)